MFSTSNLQPLSICWRLILWELHVATLILGSEPKQGACNGAGQEGSLGITSRTPGSVKECEGMNPHTPKWTPIWTSEFLEDDCRGQNSLDWDIRYIIENFLEHRCRKWVRMTHLNIWNTSYGQKKGRESNWQFDYRPDFLACRWCATYRWKDLDKGYNFALNLISIESLQRKLWAPKVSGVPSPKWESRDKMSFDKMHRGYYKGEGGGFPQVQAMMSLMSLSLFAVCLKTKSVPTMQ
jgi:hypothetical protein